MDPVNHSPTRSKKTTTALCKGGVGKVVGNFEQPTSYNLGVGCLQLPTPSLTPYHRDSKVVKILEFVLKLLTQLKVKGTANSTLLCPELSILLFSQSSDSHITILTCLDF